MAAVYRAGIRTISLTAAGAVAEVRAAASDPVYLRELKVTVGVAGASPSIALTRSTTVGTTAGPVNGQPEVPTVNPASTATLAGVSAFGAAPVLATVDIDRLTVAATLGAGWAWTWGDPGLLIPMSGSLVVRFAALSAAAATALDVTARWEE